jgi:hypothetical protein
MTHTLAHTGSSRKRLFPQRFSFSLSVSHSTARWPLTANCLGGTKPMAWCAAATYLDYWIQPLYLVHTRRGQYITLFGAEERDSKVEPIVVLTRRAFCQQPSKVAQEKENKGPIFHQLEWKRAEKSF